MPVTIAIINYGMGNLHSVYRKLSQIGVNIKIVTSGSEILQVDKIVLPGVGHFEKAMSNLNSSGMLEVLNEAVLVKKKPILGICLGMQLMAKASEEGNAKGLNWIDASVIKFKIENSLKFKVPQTGWNTIKPVKDSYLLKNIESNSEFYFLHSYHYADTDKQSILAKTDFQYEYVSAVEKENIFGTQFHPEKSHDNGVQLLRNFIQI